MKFFFPTHVANFRNNGNLMSRVKLGDVEILFKNGNPVIVANCDRQYYSGDHVGYNEWKVARDLETTPVSYQELLYHMNRMLFEQAETVLLNAIEKEIDS